MVPGHAGPPVVVGHVPRAAEGVGALQHQAVLERTVDGDLQAVVARLGARGPLVDARRPGLREVLQSGVAQAGLAVVDVDVGVAAVGRRADVGDLDRNVEREAVLEGDVPLLDSRPIEVGRVGRPHEHAARQLHHARAVVRDRHRGDAARQRRVVEELVGRVVEEDVVGERAAHRPRPGQRVVGDPVARARDRGLVQPVRRPETWREVPLLHVDAHVLRHRPAPAQQDVVGGVVEALDARCSRGSSAGSSRRAGRGSASPCR